MKILLLITAILLSSHLRSLAGGTGGLELKLFLQQSLPGARLIPEAPANPRTMISASGDPLDLMTALRENPEPRKGAGYWLTPTMRYLARQQIAVTNTNQAVSVIQLLHALTQGPGFVKHTTYRARPVDGGWVVEVENNSTKSPAEAAAMPPYELLVDASQHVQQIRERCYTYAGNPAVYDHTIRVVYEREMKLNGAINYQAVVQKELATEWDQEKAQNLIK